MSMYLGIVPALTVLAISISPEAPRLESLPSLGKLSNLRTLVSVTLPDQIDEVSYDESAGIVKVPAGVLELADLERLIASPQVGFVVWSEADAIYIGLSSVHTRAYRWRGKRLVIGTPRTKPALEAPGRFWLGSQACIEEIPRFEVTALHDLWTQGCGEHEPSPGVSEEDATTPNLEMVMLGLRDNEMRAWAELLKFARGDLDALDMSIMMRFNELTTLYRRHSMLYHALELANQEYLIEALEALDRARIMGRRYDVDAGVAMGQRIERLGNGWLMRVLVGLFQRGEEAQALDYYDTYRHWTAQHPRWLKRRIAQAMRREDRAREALKLYHEVLPGVRPPHAILGEMGTTYVEEGDAFMARSIQLWLEESRGLRTHDEFTILLRRVEAGSCPPDTAWTTRCIEAKKAEKGEHIDVLLSESAQVTWGKLVPTAGRVTLGAFDEDDRDRRR